MTPFSQPTQPKKQPKRLAASLGARPTALPGAFLIALVVLFLVAFAYATFLFFQTARAIVLNTPQLALAGGAGAETGGETGTNAGGPAAGSTTSTEALLPFLWNEQEPIHILVLGIDQRPGERGFYRTDTMIVATVDPQTGDVGILSLPRDLWVNIPGYWESRINSAHVIGDSEGYPGGGTALAKETVAQLLGQPIHYYIRINFEGFRRLLEEIGCLEIDVPTDINDPEFPDDNYGYDPLFIPAGRHCMDADLTLKYARTRHADSDFGRMERQQQVIVAIKNKVFASGQLPQLIARLPTLLVTLSESIKTDMPASQQITLANLARKLDTASIRRLVISEEMTERTILPSSADVLMPKMDVIQPAVAAFFAAGGVAEGAATGETRTPRTDQQLRDENARIAVLNGSAALLSAAPDMAQQVADSLANQGFNVSGFGDADRSDYAETQIVDYGGKSATVQVLAELLGVGDQNIRAGSGGGEVDIQIILGHDFQQQ